MKPNIKKSLSSDNNISKTGYRALFLLMKLIESPKSRSELLECFSKDPLIAKDLSKDTVTNTINALKKAGCIISRPTKKTENNYVLKSHPFCSKFSAEEIDALQAFRKSMITLSDWRMLIDLNNLFGKCCEFAPDQESIEILLHNPQFGKVRPRVLSALAILTHSPHILNIVYNSPKNGPENLDIIPHFLGFQNEKLYIWCYNFKYNDTAFLRVDRVLEINSFEDNKEIVTEKDKFVEKQFKAFYELKGGSALTYMEGVGEKIIKNVKNEEYPLKIEVTVKNKFNLIQKLLSYGTDCRIIGPDSLKADFLEALRNVKAGYIKNGK